MAMASEANDDALFAGGRSAAGAKESSPPLRRANAKP